MVKVDLISWPHTERHPTNGHMGWSHKAQANEVLMVQQAVAVIPIIGSLLKEISTNGQSAHVHILLNFLGFVPLLPAHKLPGHLYVCSSCLSPSEIPDIPSQKLVQTDGSHHTTLFQ